MHNTTLDSKLLLEMQRQQFDFTCTFNTDLVATVAGVSNTNFSVTVNGVIE